MKLHHGLHLAYCTNIHRGETWAQTFDALQRHTLAVRDRVSAGKPFAIGLRLGADAARELSDPDTLAAFRRWLDTENCYIFTINGFPYGQFHGARVKEQVYSPDWTTRERLDYTNLLFDLLAELVPEGVEGSVSTVPVSFKEFITDEKHQLRAARQNLWKCIEHIERLTRRSGRALHLGLEPEPLCWLETSEETVRFFEQMRKERPGDMRLNEHLGINYDCCHIALQYEQPRDAFARLAKHHVRISKIHLSNALRVSPTPDARLALHAFADDIYFHQVIIRDTEGHISRVKDLDAVLAQHNHIPPRPTDEWRIHFHIPLHAAPTPHFGTTADHVQGVLDLIRAQPKLCTHFEMETYTWEVMPPEMKQREVVDQLAAEYAWTLGEFSKRGIGRE